MFGFLQGFAYGLFLSCFPWLIVGMVKPRLAVPNDPPRRWQVLLRYWLIVPFIALLLWLTSLWGGFGPTLEGWLAGLAAVAVELPLERRRRRWRAARAQRRQALRREAGMAVLDPARPPAGADDVVLALCEAKGRLSDLRRDDLAAQADRLYSRYRRVLDAVGTKFDPRELTFERSRALAAEVCRAALDELSAMISLLNGIAGIDPDYVRRRLAERDLPGEERTALQRRLALVEEAERNLRLLNARIEAALTALDDAAVAIAKLDTDRPKAGAGADRALADLRRFVERAELYGHSAHSKEPI